MRILTKLIQENYDFQITFNKRKKYFDLLTSSEGVFSWKIKSPELIIFHDWFNFKLRIPKPLVYQSSGNGKRKLLGVVENFLNGFTNELGKTTF